MDSVLFHQSQKGCSVEAPSTCHSPCARLQQPADGAPLREVVRARDCDQRIQQCNNRFDTSRLERA